MKNEMMVRKNKMQWRIGLFTSLQVFFIGMGAFAQMYTPSGAFSGTSPAPFSGVGTNNPKAMMEIQLQCVSTSANPLGGLVITDNQNYVCMMNPDPNGPSYTKGDMLFVRRITAPPLSTELPYFMIRSAGQVGVGIKAPTAQLHVKPLTGNNAPFRVDASDGAIDMIIDKNKNVGIGNSATPIAKLHVNNIGGSNLPVQIDFDGGEYTYGLMYKYLGTANYHKAIAINNAAGKDVFVVHSNGYTVIGNMGSCTTLPQYGVADPGYKLVVDNGIITEKVKVAVACSADWSDYVFADGYNLKPIAEVAAYIQKNKHLPDMPSAEDMVQNGNNLGQTDALLLKQIEELWLHNIDQQKALDEMAILKKRTEELETLTQKLAEQNQILMNVLNANK